MAMDVNQTGSPAGRARSDAGKGGVPDPAPGYEGKIPAGYHVCKSTANHVLVGVRSLPVGGDVKAAVERIKTVKVHPLTPAKGWKPPTWLDLPNEPQATTTIAWKGKLEPWFPLHELLESRRTSPITPTTAGGAGI
jgi:hypothetical protein